MNFWYVNVAAAEPKNDSLDRLQGPRLAELQYRAEDSGEWGELSDEEQADRVKKTAVPIVQLFGAAPGALFDPTELLAEDANEIRSRYLKLLCGKSPDSPDIDRQLERLAEQVDIIAREMRYRDIVFTWVGGDEFRSGIVVGDYRYDDSTKSSAPHQIPIDWRDDALRNPDTSRALRAAAEETDDVQRIVRLELDQIRPLLDQMILHEWLKPRK